LGSLLLDRGRGSLRVVFQNWSRLINLRLKFRLIFAGNWKRDLRFRWGSLAVSSEFACGE
jgi:hypothetical protein